MPGHGEAGEAWGDGGGVVDRTLGRIANWLLTVDVTLLSRACRRLGPGQLGWSNALKTLLEPHPANRVPGNDAICSSDFSSDGRWGSAERERRSGDKFR